MGTRIMEEATPERLAEIQQECRGRAGDSEAESVLTWTKWGAQEGFVSIYSNRGSDIARLIDRCGSAVLRCHVYDEGVSYGVTLDIALHTPEGKKVFRGLEYAFAPIDKESKPFPKAAS